MMSRKCVRYLCIVFLILSVLFFAGTAIIFVKSYQDPRWRIFDFNSYQATEGDIYHVAEIPAVRSVRISGDRTLRFAFTPPIKARSWTIRTESDNRVISQGKYPEIPFPDKPYTETFHFTPEGATLNKDISIRISFYPKERYEIAGLSWPDNYYTPYSSVPFSIKKPHSIDEWAGLPETDPELMEARRILGNSIDRNAPSLEKSGQVFRFIMEKIKDSGGTPTDDVQNASPLETYRLLSTGEGRGWCENRALVYYLFANAAGVKTRLVDIAGKFGPLKLTGHYFCESWNPEQGCWYYVDPQSRIAHVRTAQGNPLNTLEIKRLHDLDALDDCTAIIYDRETGNLSRKRYQGSMGYFKGDIVLAYKFGYPKNRSYSKLTHFLHYPTLLYAPFTLPRLYIIKIFCLRGFIVSLFITLLSGIGLFILKGKK